MKRLFYLLFVIFLINNIYAQSTVPTNRVIYLWDVTYSMHGGYLGSISSKGKVNIAGKQVEIVRYAEKYDIYDEVIEFIINHINGQSENTEIYLIPFTDKVLDNNICHELGTAEGKEKLIAFIHQFYYIGRTHTDLYKPLNYAKQLITKTNISGVNEVNLLTDGAHNEKSSLDSLKKLLATWCNDVPENTKSYYFILNDEQVDNEIKNCSCFQVMEKPLTRKHFSLSMGSFVNIIEEYDKPLTLNIKLKDLDSPLNGETSLHIYTPSNPYINIDTTLTISENDRKILLTPHYIPSTKRELTDILPIEKENWARVKLCFEQKDATDSNNQLTNQSCEFQYINKMQKTMTIVTTDRNLGKTKYYSKFLWKDSGIDSLPEQILSIQTGRNKVNKPLKLKIVYTSKDDSNKFKPIGDIMKVWINDEIFPKHKSIDNNTYIDIKPKDENIRVRFQFKDDGSVKNDRYKICLQIVNTGDLELLNNETTEVGSLVSSCEWEVKYEKVMNPLALTLIWIGIILVTIFLIWILILRRIVFPVFSFDNLQIVYFDGDSRKGRDDVSLRGARKVICSATQQHQNALNRFFCGRIEYVTNSFWISNVELTTRGSSGIAFEEVNNAGERSQYKKPGAMITAQNGPRKPYEVKQYGKELIAKISIG